MERGEEERDGLGVREERERGDMKYHVTQPLFTRK